MTALLRSLTRATVETLFSPAARTTTANGTGVDVTKYEGTALAILDVGTTSGTTPTLDVKLQEADAVGGTYTDIPGAVFAQVAGPAQSIVRIDLDGRKRAIRGVATIGGTTPSFILALDLVVLPKY